ncbi:MAG: sugar transferase [Bacteroidota bacterium]|nr:sugar transferase [Bacteroidota bacterium]
MSLNTTLTNDELKPNLLPPYEVKQNSMRFIYVGSDEGIFNHLNLYFQSGYRKTSLDEGAEFLMHRYSKNKLLPDVLFIDVPPNDDQLNDFWSKIKNNILLRGLPVIYNEKQLAELQIKRLKHSSVVDDIITIDSDVINYSSKIMFLKQAKLHSQLFAARDDNKKQKKRFSLNLSHPLKRGIDILLASIALLILSPILLLIALIIKFESKGSVFYTSLRAGKGFKTFKFYKFRSMVDNADKDIDSLAGRNQYCVDENGPKFFKVSNDPRVTTFGKFLRNVSADELPQLLNVIKGDMSLVGNRPLPIYEAVSLTTNEFVERFSAPAGITGLWQINKRGKADMSIEERITLDITYSRNYNFMYDLKILARTPLAVFQKSNV